MKKKYRSQFNRRQYMLSKDYEVYYYEDRNHMNVEPHAHSYSEFYVYLEGDVDFEIEGQRCALQKGDCILVPPGTVHRAFVRDADVYKRVVFWISREYQNELDHKYPEFRFLSEYMKQPDARRLFHTDFITFQNLQQRIIRLLEEVHGSSYGREAALEIHVQELLLEIIRMVHAQTNPSAAEQEKNLYQSVIEYIDQHLEEDLSLERLSEIFYVSKYHISHIFKENLSVSVHQYILKKRLSHCRDALLMGEKISETFSNYGFKDYPGFYRAFKKEYGASPKEYREIHKIKGFPD